MGVPPLTVTIQVTMLLSSTDASLRLMRVDVRFPPSLLKKIASNIITPDLNVSLRPASEEKRNASLCTTDISPDSAGESILHCNATPVTEHVNRTASPGHATLVLDTREASVEMEQFQSHMKHNPLLHSYLLPESQSSLPTEDALSPTSSPYLLQDKLLYKSKM